MSLGVCLKAGAVNLLDQGMRGKKSQDTLDEDCFGFGSGVLCQLFNCERKLAFAECSEDAEIDCNFGHK